MSDFFDIPEKAISCYEKWSGLHITIHDMEQVLWPFVLPHRFHHHRPLCRAMKQSSHGPKCFAFEIDRLRQEIVQQKSGRIHVCHAGLVEWVVPVFGENRLRFVFFAGQRTPGRSMQTVLFKDPTPPPEPSPWTSTPLPPKVEAEEADLLLEGLRQLVVRIQTWCAEAKSKISSEVVGHLDKDLVRRRVFILGYIENHYAEHLTNKVLAQKLHLSESRTAHLVREACGKTLSELLTEVRVRSAASLLRHSNLVVSEIARRNGFEDVSRFHRLFKQRMGMTPHRYRREAG